MLYWNFQRMIFIEKKPVILGSILIEYVSPNKHNQYSVISDSILIIESDCSMLFTWVLVIGKKYKVSCICSVESGVWSFKVNYSSVDFSLAYLVLTLIKPVKARLWGVMSDKIIWCELNLLSPVASLTTAVNLRLAKRPLVFSGRLANRRLISLVKEDTGHPYMHQ